MRLTCFLTGITIAFIAGRDTADVSLTDLIPSITTITDGQPPVPGDGRHVLVIYETDDRISLPRDQRSILDSVPLRQWLAESQWDVKFLDPDTSFIDGDEWFQSALQVERASLPWVVVSNGKTGFSGPLPGTVEEFKELVGRYSP